MDGGVWRAAVHGVTEGRTQLGDFTFTFHFHALEKEMAAHSSVLAWTIPGMGSLLGCHLWVAQSQTQLKWLSSRAHCMQLSLVVASGACSSLPASHYSGFSCCRAQALEHRLSSCGRWALLLHGTWDLPGSWTEPSSPALAGGFFTTEPPGKSSAK